MTSPYLKENVIKNSMHYIVGRGLSGAAGFIFIILMIRYMSVNDYAAYTALTGLISFVGIVAGLGLERVLSRYIPEARLERTVKELKYLILVTTLVRVIAVTLIVIALSIFWRDITALFRDITVQSISVGLICLLLAETLFQHFTSVFQTLMLQKALTKIMIVQWAGRLVAIMIVFMQGVPIGLNVAMWIMAIPEMLGVFFFGVYLIRHLALLERNGSTQLTNNSSHANAWPDWKNVAKTASSNYGFMLLATPPQPYFMKMLLPFFLNAEYVAAYGFFVSIAERVRQYLPLHFFYSMLEPVMMANYIKDKNFDNLSARCQLLFKSNLLLMLPFFSWVAVFGEPLVAIITANKFTGLSWMLMLIIVQLLIGSHVVLLQLILNSLEKSFTLLIGSTYALVFMVLSILLVIITKLYLLLLLPPILFSLAMNVISINYLAKSGYKYRVLKADVFGYLSAALLVFMVLKLLSYQLVPSTIGLDYLVVTLFLSLLINMGILYLFKVFTPQEVNLVKYLIKSK